MAVRPAGDPGDGVIDSHQHFWDLGPLGPASGPGDYGWLADADPALYRSFGWEDLAPSLAPLGVVGTVLVQAADTDADTDAMLAVAAAHAEVLGVVAYVPLEQPDRAALRLAELQRNPAFVGVRNLVHDHSDPDWLLRPDVAEGLALLEAAHVPLDLPLVLPRHLEHLPYLGDRFPDLVLVVDHLAKPPVKTDDAEPWTSLMRAAAANPRVHAKLSGLYPSVGPADALVVADVAPWVERALELFGPQRLMVGSDWPVAVPSGGYAHVFGMLVELARSYGPDVATPLLHGTATRVYGLTHP